jgi:hypothetical protein
MRGSESSHRWTTFRRKRLNRVDINKVECQHLTPKIPHMDWNMLIDRGVNGCIAGHDMKVIEVTERTINRSGIDDHTVQNLQLVTAGGVTKTPQGNIIIMINHAADMTRDARSILSAGQLESFGCKVQDISSKVNGIPPSITTAEGYQIPIVFQKGLLYIKMHAFDKEDWSTLPRQIHITSPQEWDPSCLDAEVPDK